MTYLHAALTILAHADRPLTVGELTAVALAEDLVHPRGRTPDRSMSSILYRRMASDPDAPITAHAGRFWLRGRPLPVEGGTALRPAIRHVDRLHTQRTAGRPTARARRPVDWSAVPVPPIQVPRDWASAPLATTIPLATAGIGQRERAVGRIAERLATLSNRLAPLWDLGQEWDAERTRIRLVAPLLTLLGYRRSDQRPISPVRGRTGRLLVAGGMPTLLLEVVRSGHAQSDADARASLARAIADGLEWVVLTNGRTIRLYSTRVSGATADPGRALVLRLDPYGWTDDAERLDAARLLWLLSRDGVAAGTLDAYLTARAVGAALLTTLGDPRSPLVGALSEAVVAATGLEIPRAILARQARLAVRGPRGRDGEPLPGEIPAVAAIPSRISSRSGEGEGAASAAS